MEEVEMRLNVVSDSHGCILSLFHGPQRGGPARATLNYVPKTGEYMHVLEVPAEFENRPLAELHNELHVTTHGGRAALAKKV
jgi:hypothetical protein